MWSFSLSLSFLSFPSLFRETEQNFEEIHGTIKRGDIIGITGFQGNIQLSSKETFHRQ
jgi:hypothetical protein